MNNNLFYIDNIQEDADNLLKMFFEFHDFRISDVICHPKEETIDMYFTYDTNDMFVLLRFKDIIEFHYSQPWDYEAECWIQGATIHVNENKEIIWCNAEKIDHDKQIPDYITWIKANKLIYAMVDKDKNIIEMPAHMIHQVCVNSFSEDGRCILEEPRKEIRNFNPKPYKEI